MHIADNIVSLPLCLGGFAVSGSLAAFGLRGMDENKVAMTGVLTAFTFATTSLSLSIGVSSVHLLLYAVAGIVLGFRSVLSLAVCLAFQSVLLGHGGLTAIGVNTTIASAGALSAHVVFRSFSPTREKRVAVATIAAVLASYIVAGTLFVCALLLSPGQVFDRIAHLILLPYCVTLLIETVVTLTMIHLLVQVRPEILPLRRNSASNT